MHIALARVANHNPPAVCDRATRNSGEPCSSPYSGQETALVATANHTFYGWLANATTVPNAVYTFQSVASSGGQVSGTGLPITVTVQ